MLQPPILDLDKQGVYTLGIYTLGVYRFQPPILDFVSHSPPLKEAL